MKKFILAALPCVLLLSGCGESHYSYDSSYSSSYYSDSRSASPAYRSYDNEPVSTSARNSPPFGGYPVNPNAVCKTG